MSFNSLIALNESSFTTSATAIIPKSLLSSTKYNGVFPSFANAFAFVFISSGIVTIVEINFSLPPYTFF